MRRLRVGLGVVTAMVAVGVVAAGWWAEVPEITAAEAADAVRGAFEEAGLPAVIDGEPTASSYASSMQPAVEVWAVRATVRSTPIAVLLARSGAQPVQIDDRGPSGTEYVLSDVQYDSVASGIEDPALDRTLGRNITLTLAAGLIVAIALTLAFVPHHRTQERR